MKRILALALFTLMLTACTPQNKALTLVTHDSFVMSEELIKEFEAKTGYELKTVKAGDVGSMTTKLVLTKDSPIADVVYGIDNTFSPVAIKNNIIEGDFEPIDFADVCFNIDLNYFKENALAEPKHWSELTKPEYKNLTVIENPNTSSPGLAFLSSTYDYFSPEENTKWWSDLKTNGVKVAASWEDAYYTDFSGSSGKGKYPIVLSYSSSPAYEVDENGKPKTKALLKDCFRQTEYAAVLKNSKNQAGAKALIEFLLGDSFQKALPENMYVYPIRKDIDLPKQWKQNAKPATSVLGATLDISTNRDSWLAEYNRIFDLAP